jgi:1-acyl-sn-glycerol-3-phosphate acyltransferase
LSRLHKPKAGFWIRLCVVVLYPLAGLLFRIRWRHLDRIPPTGGVIIVINHLSQLDTVLMARLVWQAGRLPRFMVKSDVLQWPVVGTIMRGSQQIPVLRGTSDAARSLHTAIEALDRGEAVIIYPEGTTTKDPAGWPMQAKTGIARLVLLTPDTPVVPVGQWGAQRRKGWRRLVPVRRVASASVGHPLDLSTYRGAEASLSVLRDITNTIMLAVRYEVAEARGEPPPVEFFRPPIREKRKQRAKTA